MRRPVRGIQNCYARVRMISALLSCPRADVACAAIVRYERAVLFVPHGWNTAVGLAADLQLVAAVPVARWVEYITPAPYIEDLVSGETYP